MKLNLESESEQQLSADKKFPTRSSFTISIPSSSRRKSFADKLVWAFCAC